MDHIQLFNCVDTDDRKPLDTLRSTPLDQSRSDI